MSSANTHGNPVSEWNSAIQAHVDRGMSRQRAAMKVSRERPELREAVIAFANRK